MERGKSSSMHPASAAIAFFAFTACGHAELDGRQDSIPTFEEFEASVYREPFPDGVYIVNGDTPIANEKLLRE
jgi:hypothetical protein